jgi:hypothetical protein
MPSRPGYVVVNYIVLGASIVFEAGSWVRRVSRIPSSARVGSAGWRRCGAAKDPTVFTVLFEDSAALIGLVIALIGIALARAGARPGRGDRDRPPDVPSVCRCEGKRQSEIARILNQEQIKTDLGRQWTKKSVEQVLINEKYIGNNVYNRRSGKLSKRRTATPPEMWIRAPGVFPAIVDPELFAAARA